MNSLGASFLTFEDMRDNIGKRIAKRSCPSVSVGIVTEVYRTSQSRWGWEVKIQLEQAAITRDGWAFQSEYMLAAPSPVIARITTALNAFEELTVLLGASHPPPELVKQQRQAKRSLLELIQHAVAVQENVS